MVVEALTYEVSLVTVTGTQSDVKNPNYNQKNRINRDKRGPWMWYVGTVAFWIG